MVLDWKIPNSKSEIRNKFQMREMGKTEFNPARVAVIFPHFQPFGFVSDFGFRISSFSPFRLGV